MCCARQGERSMKKIITVLFSAALLYMPSALFAAGASEAKTEIKEVVIEFWTHEDVNRQRLEDRYIKEFMQANPHVTVNVKRFDSEKMADIIKSALDNNTGPTMFNLSINDEYSHIMNGRIAHVNYKAAGYKDAKALIESYAPNMLDPVTIDRHVYGLPLELTNWAIFVNKKMFIEAGLDPVNDLPKTWEDMMEVSKKIVKREGNTITRRGYDFRYKYQLENIVPMVEQLGGHLISIDEKEAIVGKGAWVNVLSFLREWGAYGQNLGSPEYTAARRLFNKASGDVAMCSSGLYQVARIKAENEEFYSSGDWMVIPYPKFKDAVKDVSACHYGHYYVVNSAATKQQEESAWALISYMLSHSEEYLREVNIIQPTLALLNSETYKSLPYSEVFIKDMERGHIVYYAENANKIQDALKTAVNGVMLEGIAPEAAYEKLKETVQKFISG